MATLAAVVVLCSACAHADVSANPGALRERAERHAPIVPRHEPRQPESPVGLMLANPLYCLAPVAGGGGAGPFDYPLLLIMAGCTGVVGAVDLVALPIQAVRRRNAARELETLERTCPVDDPAARIAVHLAGRMAGEFGFSPVPISDPEAERGEAAAPADLPDAVILRVRTTHFERFSDLYWEGQIELRSADDRLLWRWWCVDRTPRRAAATSADECAAARRDLAEVADRCIESAVGQVHARWSGWSPRKDALEPPTPDRTRVPPVLTSAP